MGIPHLTASLHPFTTATYFPRPRPSPPAPVYIDGPSFAHHIYHVISSTNPSANPWSSGPSYREFQEAAVEYLDQLSRGGLVVRKIYFDGALPPTKHSTRHARLLSSVHQLTRYHNHHPRSPPHNPPSPASTPTPFPPPPFLVSTLLSILSTHPTYSPTIHVLPSEADGHCARDAITNHGLVLTSDSDLLLYSAYSDPFAETSEHPHPHFHEWDWGVLMFRDITLSPPHHISGLVFHPTKITHILHVPLLQLAFHLQSHHFNTALQAARTPLSTTEDPSFAAFAAQYDLPAPTPPLAAIDPRISELLVQWSMRVPQPTMFLPVIWEDVTRFPAWHAGAYVRAKAYTLLFPGPEAIVSEVHRRGNRIVTTPVTRCVDGDLGGVISSGEGDGWGGVIVELILRVFKERGQVPPEPSVLCGVACMFSPPPTTATAPSTSTSATPRLKQNWTWPQVHIYAMAQAAWYSLLLLQYAVCATTTTLTVTRTTSSSGSTETEEEEGLHQLTTLPPAADCVDATRFQNGVLHAGEKEKAIVERALTEYYRVGAPSSACEREVVLPGEEEEEEEKEEGGTKKKRRGEAGQEGGGGGGKKRRKRKEWGKKSKKNKQKVEAQPDGGGNMFNLLSGME